MQAEDMPGEFGCQIVAVQSQLQNHFKGERHLGSWQQYRDFRAAAWAEWRSLAA
jgi:hypothetical protein